jgi:hypothetical protein
MLVSRRRFHFSVTHAPVAQSVERFHGKEEVTGSIPVGSSTVFLNTKVFCFYCFSTRNF